MSFFSDWSKVILGENQMTCLKGDTCSYPNCDCGWVCIGKYIWQTKKEYKKDTTVLAMGQKWICVKEHVSNIFGTDVLEHKYWEEFSYE